MRIIVGSLLLAALAVSLANPVQASTAQLNLLDMVRQTKFAVVGKVERFQTCPTKEGHIFTYVTFADVKTLQKEGGSGAKDAPDRLTLRMPGGMVDGRVEIVTDAPIFRQGEYVILFLTRDPQQQVPIVQGSNGVLLIEGNERVRSYNGPYVTKIDRNFDIRLDPSYKPDPKLARHWDPNMAAVWKPARKREALGRPPYPAIVGKPMTLQNFARHLKRAWNHADKLGRLPEKLDFSPRRPYGETPMAPRLK